MLKPLFIRFYVLALICILPFSAHAEMQDKTGAVLRGLDKVSAQIQTFELPLDQTVRFGKNLFIRVRACRKSEPIDTPESAAFIEVWEKNIETDESDWVFSGWMYASSPAVSAMDHQVYDVWVVDCKNVSKTAISGSNETADPKTEETPPPEGTN